MSIHTILVHVDHGPHSGERTRVACALARRHNAHVIGAATSGLSRFLYASLPSEQNDPTLALHLQMLREQANGALDAFLRQCQRDAPPTHEARLIDDEAGAGLALHARGADLAVMSQAEAAHASSADLAAHVVLHAGRPVLILPVAALGVGLAQHPLVAWDASREAARALQLSLPLLARAGRVSVALIHTVPPGRDALDARMVDPVVYLKRHGIDAVLVQHTIDGQHRAFHRNAIGEALLSVVADRDADLLVMGGYGHSRVRETILGGVTRSVLEAMTVPVMMAH